MKTIEFTTAQHVKIEYELAGTGQRVVASIIDLFAFFLYFVIVGLAIGQSLFSLDIGTSKFVTLMLFRIPWIFLQSNYRIFNERSKFREIYHGNSGCQAFW
jgi:uncharacterized RDD family membrane protein YckC